MPEQLRPEPKDLGEAATFIPNSSFLITHLSKAFILKQGTSRPGVNPEPKTFFKKTVDTIAQDVIVLYPSLMKRPRSKER